jgi:hypothetical protein
MGGLPTPPVYLLALVATLAVESPVYGLLLRLVKGIPFRTGLGAGAAVNLVSHPLAFLVLFPLVYPRIGAVAALAAAEVFAVGCEALLVWIWRRDSPAQLAGISYVANALSFSIGLLAVSR